MNTYIKLMIAILLTLAVLIIGIPFMLVLIELIQGYDYSQIDIA